MDKKISCTIKAVYLCMVKLKDRGAWACRKKMGGEGREGKEGQIPLVQNDATLMCVQVGSFLVAGEKLPELAFVGNVWYEHFYTVPQVKGSIQRDSLQGQQPGGAHTCICCLFLVQVNCNYLYAGINLYTSLLRLSVFIFRTHPAQM